MIDIINLRNWRKRRAKAEAEEVATRNRLIHGQTKLEKVMLKTEAAKLATYLDGHHIKNIPDDRT